MKKSSREYRFVLLLILLALNVSCLKQDNGIRITKNLLSGYAQKGPYINGTSIQIYELNSDLNQTGKVFSTQIINNSGAFEINDLTLNSKYADFVTSGYYFDEVTGVISSSELTLYAIADISEISKVNINILTNLEKNRVKYLVSQGKSFTEAKLSAQKDVLAIFGLNKEDMDNSEMLDISVDEEENGILLAISLILQGQRSAGDLTELLANINSDIKEDGILDDTSLLTDLRRTTLLLDLAKVRTNLEKRYTDLGITTTIPVFEKYIDDFLVFTGSEPITSTKSATNITTASATLNGTVNANDLTTTVTFEYGITEEYNRTASATPYSVAGHLSTDVSALLTDLSPGTTYHFRVRSINSLGITTGNDMTFTTSGLPPSARTLKAELINNTEGVKMKGIVNPNFLNTVVSFEYGPTINYGYTQTVNQNPINGTSELAVEAIATGLEPVTTYHFRIKAENELGTVTGNDNTFKTKGIVSDIDGNSYVYVKAGTQIWMSELLKTTTYNDGTPIPLVTDNTEWAGLSTPGYCWFENDKTKNGYRGALYNWYCIDPNTNGNKNICPTGWHVPTISEWLKLSSFLGGYNTEIEKRLSNPDSSYNFISTSGILRHYGSTIWDIGTFGVTGEFKYEWTSTESTNNSALKIGLSYPKLAEPFYYEYSKRAGIRVRCIKN